MHFIKGLSRIFFLAMLSITVLFTGTVKADANDLAFVGASYVTGGGINLKLVTGNLSGEGGYGTIVLNIKSAKGLPQRAVNDVYGGHLGMLLGGTDNLSFGLGGLWGYSVIGSDGTNDPNNDGDNFGHYGVELPILYKANDALPILFLPFWEKATAESKSRYGTHLIANFQAMEPLSINFEGGLYFVNKGLGYNWSISIGIDFW